MKSRIAAILMSTMTLLAFGAFSHAAHQDPGQHHLISRNAGRLNHAPVALPSTKHRDCDSRTGRWKPKTLSSRSLQIRRKAHGDRHVGDGVFEDQVPADDPGEDLAQGRVGVGVGAAGDRNHRRQFGVAQRREAAGDRHQQEGNRDGRTRAGPADGADGVPAVQEQVEHRRFEDRLDSRT